MTKLITGKPGTKVRLKDLFGGNNDLPQQRLQLEDPLSGGGLRGTSGAGTADSVAGVAFDIFGDAVRRARVVARVAVVNFGDLSERARRVPGLSIDGGQILLGNFAYRKIPMVLDVQSSLQALADHGLISAMAGDPAAVASFKSGHAHWLDPAHPDSVPSADEYLMLDADS